MTPIAVHVLSDQCGTGSRWALGLVQSVTGTRGHLWALCLATSCENSFWPMTVMHGRWKGECAPPGTAAPHDGALLPLRCRHSIGVDAVLQGPPDGSGSVAHSQPPCGTAAQLVAVGVMVRSSGWVCKQAGQ